MQAHRVSTINVKWIFNFGHTHTQPKKHKHKHTAKGLPNCYRNLKFRTIFLIPIIEKYIHIESKQILLNGNNAIVINENMKNRRF